MRAVAVERRTDPEPGGATTAIGSRVPHRRDERADQLPAVGPPGGPRAVGGGDPLGELIVEIGEGQLGALPTSQRGEERPRQAGERRQG